MSQNSTNTPIVLTSAGPVDDCGRKYNVIYAVCGIAGLVIGLFAAQSFAAGIAVGVLGLGIGWVVKNAICNVKQNKFRDMVFTVDQQIPYGELTTKLVGVLVPLGMSVENAKDGSISVTHKGMIYDISYKSKTSFSVWWRTNLANAFFGVNAIGRYRKISQTTGILAYHVQQICSESKQK